MAIEFDPTNKLIKITSGTSITALEIYNAVMDWCDEQPTIVHSVPMAAIGKAPLGGGVYTDSIFILQDGWKIKFWSGTYQAVITGTVITDDGTPRTVPPDSGNVEVILQVSSQGIIIPGVGEWTQTEKDTLISDVGAIQAKTVNIPSDLSNVPTDPELDAKHGSGSWEGATPAQVWNDLNCPRRALTTRALACPTSENIANESTLEDIKKIVDKLEAAIKEIKVVTKASFEV